MNLIDGSMKGKVKTLQTLVKKTLHEASDTSLITYRELRRIISDRIKLIAIAI